MFFHAQSVVNVSFIRVKYIIRSQITSKCLTNQLHYTSLYIPRWSEEKKTKLNEWHKWKLEKNHSQQQTKHAKLYSDLLPALKRERLIVMGSLQRGPQFLHPNNPPPPPFKKIIYYPPSLQRGKLERNQSQQQAKQYSDLLLALKRECLIVLGCLQRGPQFFASIVTPTPRVGF